LAASVADACGLTHTAPPRSEIDWDHVFFLVRRHRVAPLVHRSGWLSAHGAPPQLVEELAGIARGQAVAALRRLAIARELVNRLSDLGIPSIVLKGPTLAQDAFGDVGARDDRDVDLLVTEQRLPEVIDVLSAQGLAFAENPRRSTITREILEDPIRRGRFAEAEFADNNTAVDVHWRLTRNPYLLPTRIGTPRLIDAGGTTLPALPMPDAFFYAMVHGTAHGWFRLKWIADVAGLISRHPELTSPSTLQAAKDAGLQRCVAAGLLIAELVLGKFLSDEGRAWAQSIRGTQALVSISSRWLCIDDDDFLDPHNSPRDGFDEARLALSMRPDHTYRKEEARWLLIRAGRLQRREAAPTAWALATAPLSYLARLRHRFRR
jgi:hypothetical protein